jgi:hypothetical protein
MRRATIALAFTALAAALLTGAASLSAPGAAQAAPRSFFGIVPQHALTDTDAEYMRVGRIGSVRWPLGWEAVQSSPTSGYDWSGYDEIVATAARQRLRVLPFFYGSPGWIAGKYTRLPIDNARQRRAWAAFVGAAVERYGPRGEFWREHNRASGDFVPKLPVKEWQVWNEANFFYFATPASPGRYARLLKISNRAIKRADPRAKVILTGLFAEPNARPPRAMHAVDFLDRLYRVRGIKASFDGVALHPYAESARDMARMTEEMRRVMIRNRDLRAGLYMTEIGWGSDNNPNLVSFEQGVGFQLREMRLAYRYMLGNRGRLNLKSAYWFTWKDLAGSCNFCDSTGFFRRGNKLKPKPAWRAFVRISGGRVRP